MNFYEHQDRARRRTALLVAYFVLAVVLIIVSINLVGWMALSASSATPLPLDAWPAHDACGAITIGVLVLIGGGSLWTGLRLSGGGPALARMIGARRVDADSSDASEQRLVNVVEEMSIASGTPVPALYVLDSEPGINAFVAGTRPTETILVVTRGALENFSRDELQGVVAHEYSHIFNNDMRLNIRLMAVLAGILVIGQLGRFMLRSGTHSRNRNAAQWALAGLVIMLLGYVGLFFGNLIKAAVSRQREFLADASAVQFTRYPDGICAALDRIRAASEGSIMNGAHAEDLSHFCFSESVHHALAGLLATHPPLDERIAAINPDFQRRDSRPPDNAAARAPDVSTPGHAFAGAATTAPSAAAIAASVGQVSAAHLAQAQSLTTGFDTALKQAVHGRDGAMACVLGLLRAASAADRRDAISALVSEFDTEVAARMATLNEPLDAMAPSERLPLVQLALPSLKSVPEPRREAFRSTLGAVAAADREFTLFEFVVLFFIDNHLAADAARAVPVRHYRFANVAGPLNTVLTQLALAGNDDEAAAAAAFERAWVPFALPGEFNPASVQSPNSLHAALDALAALAPLLKQSVMQAAADCVIHDQRITVAEAELLRVIGLALDCPLPLMLETMPGAGAGAAPTR